MDSFAIVDNKLAGSQLGIGLSANLAQVALSYSYNFSDRKYYDAVCILATLSQVCIDSAKKSYDMDLLEEIKRVRGDIDVDNNKFPKFWLNIRKGFNKQRINKALVCPMNYLYDIEIDCVERNVKTIPIGDFLIDYNIEKKDKIRRTRKIEELITKYSFNYYRKVQANGIDNDSYSETMILLRDDFDQLIEDLRKTAISKNYLGFMGYLIDKAFYVTPNIKWLKGSMQHKLSNNRSLLLKVLYEINPEMLLKCFSKNILN